MAESPCEVCGRPATARIRRMGSGEPPRVVYLCDIHAAEVEEGPSSSGGNLFDDFFGRFFHGDEERQEMPSGDTVSESQAEQVNVTQFFSDATHDLVQR